MTEAPTSLAARLEGYRYDLTSEDSVQRGIAKVLDEDATPYDREVPVNGGRLDFLLGTGVAIEVKLHGSTADLIRQLHRYAKLGEVRSLLVVTTRHRLAQLPVSLGGKPVAVALLVSSCL